MKIAKKITAVAIICAVLMSVAFTFTACEREPSAPTLIWWMVGTSQAGFNRDMRVISDYIEEKIGVRLDIRLAGWGEAAQRFNTMINAGIYYDIMFVDGGTYNRFVRLGAFADLTDLIPEYAPELLEVIPDLLWEGVRINNRIFSIPTYKDSAITAFFFWDGYFVDKYDIDLTRTDFEYLDYVFRRMRAGESDPRFHPFRLARGSNPFIFDIFDGLSASLPPMGVRLDDPERRVINTLLEEDLQEKLRFMYSWFRDGIINPDANLVDELPIGRPFFMAQAWPSVAYMFADTEGVERYEAVPFFGPSISTGSIQGSMNAINVNSRHKGDALRLLQLVNTDTKLRDMLHVGIEGRHFEYIEDGTLIRRLRTDWPLSNFQQGNFFVLTPLDTMPPGFLDEIRAQNEAAAPSTVLGFNMDLEPVMIEMVNATSVWDRFAVDLTLGAANPDVLIPQIIEQLMAVGFDRIMAEAQRQIDEHFGMN